MRDFISAFVRNRVLANVLLLIIVVVGIIAAVNMTREFFPETSVDMITITIIYPGADPEEVEEGICRKIEESLDNLDGVKRYTTNASEHIGSAYVEVADGADVDEVKDRVRNAVDSISTFPVEAEKPIISEITSRQDVLYLALWGSLPERQLKEWAERIKDELQRQPAISQVNILGTREYEIAVEVSEERLREYGLTFAQVSSAVRRGSLNLSGGVIRTKGEEIRVRTVGRKYTGKDFASIVVLASPNGEIITLDRLATIKDGFTEDTVYSTFNGQPCAVITVRKTGDEDAIAVADAVNRFVAQREQSLPEGLHISPFFDMTNMIEARIRLLSRNGLIGLTLVFLLLWTFLELRLSFWVAMGIPISLSGALAIMWALGSTLNMLSLFALILVLGIIVDDAIVVGEAIYVHRRRGKGRLQAAVDGVFEVGLPVIAAVTTTIVAFLPLGFTSGIMGKFMVIIPIGVISALSISLVECLFLLPAHLNHLPDLNAPVESGHPWQLRAKLMRRRISRGMEWFVEHVYTPFVSRAVHWRYVSLSIGITVILLTLGLWRGGVIKFITFPPIDGDIIISSIEFPDGTPIAVTREAIDTTRNALERVASSVNTLTGDPLLKAVYTTAGQSANLSDMIGGSSSASNVGQVFVELLESEKRGIHYEDLIVAWEKEIGAIPGVISQSFVGMETGPPGADIEIWLQGENMDMLLSASAQLKDKLRSYDGLYQVQDDYRPGKNELRIDIKPEAHTLGLTLQDLARQVYAGYYGEEALRLQRGRDDIRVRVRYPRDERDTLAELEQIRIRTMQGYEVPFFSVADVHFAKGYSTITRVDGQRSVTVTAEIDHRRANAQEVLTDLKERYLASLVDAHPGLSWAFMGPQEDTRESLTTLRRGFIIALLGIFVIIATTFRSYIQPFIIMVSIPFGIIGAVLGHIVMGMPLTIMSMFGGVALAGVVVNDAIILIECVNSFIANGMPFFEALSKGGARRFRAIFLTTVSTCAGLLPIILEKDLQARFLIPMALSLAAGVAFSTVVTLVLIPSLMGILNDIRRIKYALVHRRWPTPEEVEPATKRYAYLEEEQTGPIPANQGA